MENKRTEGHIDRLSEVTGIATKRIAMIQRTWAEQKSIKDLMTSNKIHVFRLTQVFRQASESAIITTAHQINRGQIPQ
ncbi:MAG: hypothetical protein QNJ55_35155 [Xenococcus sp. MO_188.B8]|nr:hypothetical protein [Xenococcus sp. MO_188.B8]